MGEQRGWGRRHTQMQKLVWAWRVNAHPSGNWSLGQGVYGGRAGRQRESKPHIPPPPLTSHPEASGKRKSMGSLSALGSVAGI